jgi:hypothetical protein
MIKNRQTIDFFVFTILLSAALVSCSQKEEPITDYTIPYYETLYFTDGLGYEFASDSSNKLLIALDGAGLVRCKCGGNRQ